MKKKYIYTFYTKINLLQDNRKWKEYKIRQNVLSWFLTVLDLGFSNRNDISREMH